MTVATEGEGDDLAGRLGSHRKEAPSITIAPIPDAVNFRSWKLTTLREIAGSAVDPIKAFKWISRCDEKEIEDEELLDLEPFPSLDGKIVTALNRVLVGEMLRKTQNQIQYAAKKGEYFSGRNMLRVIFRHFRTSEEHGSLYAVSDLLQMKMTSNSFSGLETFWTSWRWIEGGLEDPVGDEIKKSILFDQIKHYKPIEVELLPYTLSPPGDKRRTYQFLVETVNRRIDRVRQEKTREA